MQPQDGRLAARARALHGLGLLAFPQGEYDLSRAAYAAALDLWHQLGDESGAAYTLPGLGLAELHRGDLIAARGYLEAGVSAATSSQKASALALSLAFLARVEQDEGDVGTARTLAEQALSVASAAGYTRRWRLHADGDFIELRATVNGKSRRVVPHDQGVPEPRRKSL
jgi:tetratricopeptide (TPR) repeat protein